VIYNYVSSNDSFNAWSHVSGTTWNEISSVNARGVTTANAESTKLERGKAFWLVRSEPTTGDGGTNYIYLVGRYTGEDYVVELEGGTTSEPGSTLCANPTTEDIGLNSLVFVDGDGNAATPADGDKISVPTASGILLTYSRKNGEWGRNKTTRVGNRLKKTWASGGTIPAGTGFWYSRTAETALKIKFGGAL